MIIFLFVLLALSLLALGFVCLVLRLNNSRNRLLPVIAVSCVYLLSVLFWFEQRATLFTESAPQSQATNLEVSQP